MYITPFIKTAEEKDSPGLNRKQAVKATLGAALGASLIERAANQLTDSKPIVDSALAEISKQFPRKNYHTPTSFAKNIASALLKKHPVATSLGIAATSSGLAAGVIDSAGMKNTWENGSKAGYNAQKKNDSQAQLLLSTASGLGGLALGSLSGNKKLGLKTGLIGAATPMVFLGIKNGIRDIMLNKQAKITPDKVAGKVGENLQFMKATLDDFVRTANSAHKDGLVKGLVLGGALGSGATYGISKLNTKTDGINNMNETVENLLMEKQAGVLSKGMDLARKAVNYAKSTDAGKRVAETTSKLGDKSLKQLGSNAISKVKDINNKSKYIRDMAEMKGQVMGRDVLKGKDRVLNTLAKHHRTIAAGVGANVAADAMFSNKEKTASALGVGAAALGALGAGTAAYFKGRSDGKNSVREDLFHAMVDSRVNKEKTAAIDKVAFNPIGAVKTFGKATVSAFKEVGKGSVNDLLRAPGVSLGIVAKNILGPGKVSKFIGHNAGKIGAGIHTLALYQTLNNAKKLGKEEAYNEMNKQKTANINSIKENNNMINYTDIDALNDACEFAKTASVQGLTQEAFDAGEAFKASLAKTAACGGGCGAKKKKPVAATKTAADMQLPMVSAKPAPEAGSEGVNGMTNNALMNPNSVGAQVFADRSDAEALARAKEQAAAILSKQASIIRKAYFLD